MPTYMPSGRDNLTVGTREVCSSDSLMNMIPRFRWFKGQQWFVLHRSAAEYILRGDDGLGLRMRYEGPSAHATVPFPCLPCFP